jgi:hypothetical protein
VAAALAARAYDRVLGWLVSWSRPTSTAAAVHVIFFGAVVGLSYIYVEPLYAPWAKPIWDAAIETRRITPDGALVIFADDGDSSGLYYSERKGWHAFLDDSRTGNPLHSDQAIRALEDLRKQGAAYLVFSRNTLWWLDYYREFRQYLDAHYTRARDTEDYIIFDLSKHQLQADSASRDPDLMSVPIAYPRDGS